MWIFYVFFFSVLCLLCFHARLFVDASPAGKELTSWPSFVMSNCDVVTFPLVSWVRCGALLYRFLIFALFLTLKVHVYVNFDLRRIKNWTSVFSTYSPWNGTQIITVTCISKEICFEVKVGKIPYACNHYFVTCYTMDSSYLWPV